MSADAHDDQIWFEFMSRRCAPYGSTPAVTDNKLAELRPTVYDALMNRSGNTSRFHMAPGTSSALGRLLSPMSRKSETDDAVFHAWQASDV